MVSVEDLGNNHDGLWRQVPLILAHSNEYRPHYDGALIVPVPNCWCGAEPVGRNADGQDIYMHIDSEAASALWN